MTRAKQAKGLPVNQEPVAEFFHSFSRPGQHETQTLSAEGAALAGQVALTCFFELPRLPVLPDPIPVKVSAVHRYVNTGREALSERQGAS